MEDTPAVMFLAALLLLLLCQGGLWLTVSVTLKRKAWNAYCTQTPLLRRYFLLNAANFARNTYSKLEKKRMPNREIAEACSAASILLHAAFGLCCVGALAFRSQASVLFRGYLILCMAMLLIWCIADEIIHRRFWRSKRR